MSPGKLESLRTAWFLGIQDLKHLLRHREVVVWAFVMPLVFVFFVGTMSDAVHPRRSGRIRFAVESEQGDVVAARLRERLGGLGMELGERTDSREPVRVLSLPADFGERMTLARDVTLDLELTGDGMTASQDAFVARSAAGLVALDLARLAARGVAPSAAAFAELDRSPAPTLELVVTPGGPHDANVAYGFRQAVPGILLAVVLVTFLTSGAVLLVGERREGLLVRFVSAPVSRATVVLGKAFGRFLLAAFQLGFGLAAALLLFGADGADGIGGPGGVDGTGGFHTSSAGLVVVALVFLSFAALASAAALLLGSLARTEAQALTIGAIGSNALAALGGLWFPIGLGPPWMLRLSRCLPTGWAIDAVQRATAAPQTTASIGVAAPSMGTTPWLEIAALVASALVLFGLAARAFRLR